MADLLHKIEIENFKGYGAKQTVNIAIPNGADGSGLTVVVGENNTGKSTIVDAIKKLHRGAKFLPKERHGGKTPLIVLTDKNGNTKSITKGKKATVAVTGSGLLRENSFEIVPSRRHWRHNFQAGNLSDYNTYLTNTFGTDSRESTDAHLGGLLEKISDDAHLKSEFDVMMAALIPGFANWEIDTDDRSQDYVKYSCGSNLEHDTSLVGDGLISLFRICAHLVSTNNDLLLIIDEPELSLSPITQRRLGRLIAEKAREKQIIVNTHSPHLINWQDLANGAYIYRTVKRDNGQCEIRRFDTTKPSFVKLLSSVDDWQKPHVLDAVAKEIFFTEKVLFLEGQEDVGLVRKFISDQNIVTNFEIFGYGTGGSANIPFYFEMCRDLGIKAAALFDSGAPGITGAMAYTEFKVIEHPFADIRYKPAKDGKPEKQGLFNEDGTITSANSDILKAKVSELIDYFR
ncbi:MAG: AAA family ATPase [Bdellovibrionales bacterium]|nr:AAA family ATPase [Bdellovibrionales bacterium]